MTVGFIGDPFSVPFALLNGKILVGVHDINFADGASVSGIAMTAPEPGMMVLLTVGYSVVLA